MNSTYCKFLSLLIFLVAGAIPAMAARQIDLSGQGWTFRTTLDEKAVDVAVPHCWPASEQYRKYIGDAVYEHDFFVPPIAPGQVVRLHFDAVYNHAAVWLNGHKLGEHNGGYTPFEFEVTNLLIVGKNHLLVEVNNVPTLTTIPALATARESTASLPYGSYGGEGIVGWMPYGGIVRPVSLLITDAVYLRRMKIDSKPDLATHRTTIEVHVWAHNGGLSSAPVEVKGAIAGLSLSIKRPKLASGEDVELSWVGILSDTHLWSLRDPFLYDAVLRVPGDELNAKIGIRDIRVQGPELLLNGKVVHLFGGNRISEDQQEGLRESGSIIKRDMDDMLADNMRMMRIAHYPQAPALLDYADKHGILLIAEAGNWNMSAWQMADPGIRETWKEQMREMMEQDWNHPSVIAWSMGNEYESYTQEGIEWTRDMRKFTLGIDPSRLITFASRFTADPAVKSAKDEASQYSDFVSVNLYVNFAQRLDHVHELYPDKPVFVTEFGLRGDAGLNDPARIQYITEAVSTMKQRPWVIGGELWSWNDYRSLHRGTSPSGVRYWGVVTLDRRHRDSWSAVQKLFATELP